MTERGLPLADGAPACPFVAFEDDRDERASVPDHRHRCYADARPAPRALAHQEAYCLSSAFPVCPTFQDWARREAARARGGAATAPNASAGMNRAATGAASDAAAATEDRDSQAAVADAATSGAWGAAVGGAAAMAAAGLDVAPPDADASPVVHGPSAPQRPDRDAAARADRWGDPGDRDREAGSDSDDREAGSDSDDRDDRDDRAPRRGADESHPDDLVRRNPPRDWAAPPPWLASDERRRAVPAEPPPFLGRRATDPGRGLAGSPADRLAGGPLPAVDDDPDDAVWSSDSRSAAAAGAGIASDGDRAATRRRPSRDDDHDEYGRDDEPRPARRPRAYAQHLGGPDGPDWERPRRFEAYPTIKTRVGLPSVPPILGLVALVAVLALALFFLPGILNIGGPAAAPGGSVQPSTVAGPSVSIAPTEPPAPTPSVYTIKKGETLSKIATAHGITIEELLAANPKITNPNRISEGQQIVIPVPSEEPPDEVGESTAP